MVNFLGSMPECVSGLVLVLVFVLELGWGLACWLAPTKVLPGISDDDFCDNCEVIFVFLFLIFRVLVLYGGI